MVHLAYLEMFSNMPIETSMSVRDDPPALIRGNVIPVTGIKPITTPMLMTTDADQADDPCGQQTAERIGSRNGRAQSSPYEKKKKDQHQRSANESQFFSDNGKNKVGLRFR